MDAPDALNPTSGVGPVSSSTPSSSMPAPSSATEENAGAARHTSVRQMLRQQREMDEKRKFGLAPLAVDAVTHAEISPNIPQSISRAPWYYGATGPTLEHQRKHDGHRDDRLEDHVQRVVTTGHATKFVPGACQNCGSRTHKTAECVRAKKRVGAVYTNHITGKDVTVTVDATSSQDTTGTSTSEPTYAQKRDRFAGNIKLDLFELYAQKDDPGSSKTPGEGEETGEGPVKRRRLGHDLFREQAAQHGGVEIKELPKYLQNLDAMLDGSVFFDPKTGSMRGNPNAHDPTQLFQGDMQRAQTGGHDDYLETQHRFLTGQSKSFVDLEYDDMMRERQLREAAARQSQADRVNRVENAHDLLVRSLYGDTASSSNATATASTGPSTATPIASKKDALQALASAAASSTAAPRSAASDPETREAVRLERLMADWHDCVEAGSAQRRGHACTFGSWFDLEKGEWGYQCCRQLGAEAPPCSEKSS